MSPAEVLALIGAFDPAGDGELEKSRELIGMMLTHSPNPFSRDQFQPGHMTATACVLHPAEQSVLLIRHKRLDRWLLPGGHVEIEDRTPDATAMREAVEETSVRLEPSVGLLVGMDVHGIPPKKREPFHLHHDLIFSFRAAAVEVGISEETRGVVWCAFGDFEKYGLAGSIRRAAIRSWEPASKQARMTSSS